MGYATKSCGHAHAWCKECLPEASEALSDAMLGNVNQSSGVLSPQELERLRERFAGRHAPREERQEALRLATAASR
jgi:hypothetical protein